MKQPSAVRAAIILVLVLMTFTVQEEPARAIQPTDAGVGWNEEDAHVWGEAADDGSQVTFPAGSDGQQTTSQDPPIKYMKPCLIDFDDISILCMMQTAQCGSGRTLAEVYERSRNPEGAGWISTGTLLCIAPAENTDAETIPNYKFEDFRNLSILAAASGVQPSPHTLIGAQTNMYALAERQSFTETVAGFSVRVNAVPSGYSWDYGDGSSLGPIQEAGGPLAPERWGEQTATSHVYVETGDYQVVLTTYFTGEYSVDGGPWMPIPGQAAVPSESATVSVWRAVTNNYAENCLQNSQGIGC